jgi:hypothetical protein
VPYIGYSCNSISYSLIRHRRSFRAHNQSILKLQARTARLYSFNVYSKANYKQHQTLSQWNAPLRSTISLKKQFDTPREREGFSEKQNMSLTGWRSMWMPCVVCRWSRQTRDSCPQGEHANQRHCWEDCTPSRLSLVY